MRGMMLEKLEEADVVRLKEPEMVILRIESKGRKVKTTRAKNARVLLAIYLGKENDLPLLIETTAHALEKVPPKEPSKTQKELDRIEAYYKREERKAAKAQKKH